MGSSGLVFASNPASAKGAGADLSLEKIKALEAENAAHFFVGEYRVQGVHQLKRGEIESAVYPYLGPARTVEDVEKARVALEKAYRDKGYQAVSVQIPEQKMKGGVVLLQVLEGQVGQLRIRGSRYFSPSEIKKEAPSLAEGSVVDFNRVTKDLAALNQWRDRRITPSLRAGVEPGQVDVDLTVKDTYPLHGSAELNNRFSSGTPSLRLNAAASYSNLWQMGHTLGMSFQVAPENFEKVKVLSGYYLAPVPDVEWLSLMLQGTKQDSNVSTLGGAGAVGKGEILGLRAILTLPGAKDFFQSITLGLDYKHFDSALQFGTTKTSSPITYFPLSASYGGTWTGKDWTTELNLMTTFHARGVGSSPADFDSKRYKSGGDFITFHGDVSHTREFLWTTQLFGKIQAQGASGPLIDSEQFSGGGLGSARGYLESEQLGDNALFGTAEWRTPSLTPWLDAMVTEWRFYVFGDAGMLSIDNPLAGQTSSFELASVGVGTRIKLQDHYNGSIDMGIPMLKSTETKANEPIFTFRLWAEF
jgi:hemolysin activation/secretion protein